MTEQDKNKKKPQNPINTEKKKPNPYILRI